LKGRSRGTQKGTGGPLTTFTKVYKEGETITPSSTHEITIIASSFRTVFEIKKVDKNSRNMGTYYPHRYQHMQCAH
jgi:hypothetical protein